MALDMVVSDRNQRGRVLTAWFNEYQTAVLRYLVRLVGDEERAANLLQDTFVRALAALDPNALPTNPSAWLYRIATNLTYDALRRQRRWQWLPLRTVIALGAPFEVMLSWAVGDVADRFEIAVGPAVLGLAPLLVLVCLPWRA